MLFPPFQYASTLGVHTSLLFFTVFFLPRTSLLFYPSPSQFPFRQPSSSRDRPQLPFFVPLTASPVLTLGWMCLGLGILVVWWASWIRNWAYKEYQRGSKASDIQAKTEQLEWRKRGVWDLRSALFMTLFMSLVYHVVVILFGAPISSHQAQTYLLSLQLSILTVLPSAYVLGTPSFPNFFNSDPKALAPRLTWTRLFAELSPRNGIERAVLYPVIGTMVGCWCGCIPIGLDWDRPWQAWPLTPAYGSVFGYVGGSLAALIINFITPLPGDEKVSIQTPAAKSPTNSKLHKK